MAHESMRIFHPGRCFWYGLESKISPPGFDWIDVSVGVEHAHQGMKTYPDNQVGGTKNLIQRIRAAYGTSPHNVLGHGEIGIHDPQRVKKLGRKLLCPGERYEWPYLERSGNATKPVTGSGVIVPHLRYGDFFNQFPDEAINTIKINKETKAKNIKSILPVAIAGLQLTLSELGYFVNFTAEFDEPTIRAIEAFQVRYFSGRTRDVEPKQYIHGRVLLANLITVRRMHEVLAARGTFKF
jgi:N-acetyl-anhydromuramyl-L-alanine amidase AmpD